MALTGNETFLTTTNSTATAPNSSRLTAASNSGLFLNVAGGEAVLDTSAEFKALSAVIDEGFIYSDGDNAYKAVTIENSQTIAVNAIGGGTTMSMDMIPSTSVQLTNFEAEGIQIGTGDTLNIEIGAGLVMQTDFTDGKATYIIGADGEGSGTITSVTATSPLTGGTATSGAATIGLPTALVNMNTLMNSTNQILATGATANTAVNLALDTAAFERTSNTLHLKSGSNIATLNNLVMNIGNAGKVVRVNSGGTALELGAPDEGGTVTSVGIVTGTPGSSAAALTVSGTVTTAGNLTVTPSIAANAIASLVHGTSAGLLGTTGTADGAQVVTAGSGLTLSGASLALTANSPALLLNSLTLSGNQGKAVHVNPGGDGFVLSADGGGTVTSVAIAATTSMGSATGLHVVTGSPITTSGTINLALSTALNNLSSTVFNAPTGSRLLGTTASNVSQNVTVGSGLNYASGTLAFAPNTPAILLNQLDIGALPQGVVRVNGTGDHFELKPLVQTRGGSDIGYAGELTIELFTDAALDMYAIGNATAGSISHIVNLTQTFVRIRCQASLTHPSAIYANIGGTPIFVSSPGATDYLQLSGGAGTSITLGAQTTGPSGGHWAVLSYTGTLTYHP